MIRHYVLCASLFSLSVGVAALPAHAQTPAAAPKPAPAQTPVQPAAPGELKFDSVSFSDVIDHLREVTGVNIHVNWKALETAGVPKDAPVTIHLRSVTLRTALKVLLDDVAPGGAVTWYADDGVIEITTKELADSAMITRVYDVSDILLEIPDFTETQQANFTSATRGGTGGGGGNSGGGGNLFGGANQQSSQNIRTKADRAADIVKLIETTIQPTIWKDNGGTASIVVLKNQLIVTAPRSVHEAIAGR
jgi:hypothetical protein